MSEEQVSSHLIESSTQPTATAFIITARDGHNIITLDLGSLNTFTSEDVKPYVDLFDSETIVLMQLECPLKTSLQVGKIAKERGATVVLNPAPAVPLGEEDLSCIDFLIPNETEAAVCLGKGPESAEQYEENAKLLNDLGVKNIIVTLGEQGCYLFDGTYGKLIPGFPVDKRRRFNWCWRFIQCRVLFRT